MTTKTIEQLEQQIERLVRDHLAAQRKAATAAVERAFAASTAPKRVDKPSRSTSSPRRQPAEVASLGERLYAAVRAHPGETMAVIAPTLGESARALNRPMWHLKRAGRVRSAGQKHLTRYFPMTGKSA